MEAPPQEVVPEVEIAPNDPIVAYFASASGVVEIDKLDLDSPALKAMKAADIKVVVPLERVMNLGKSRIEMRISRSAWFPRDLCFPHS